MQLWLGNSFYQFFKHWVNTFVVESWCFQSRAHSAVFRWITLMLGAPHKAESQIYRQICTLVSTDAMSLVSSANALLHFLIVLLKHTSNLVLGQHGYCLCPFNYSNKDALGDKLFVALKIESKWLLVQKESRSVVRVQFFIHHVDKKHLLSWAGCLLY